MAEDILTISFAGRDALEEIHALVRRCYGDAAESLAWWAWRHFGAGAPPTEICLARLGPTLAGIQPLHWSRFHLGEAVLAGGVLTGVMVDPAFRRRGLFTTMIRACEKRAWERGADLLLTMPNDRSRPGFRKLGWTDPGPRTLLLRVLAPEAVAPRFLKGALRFLGARLSSLVRQGPGRDEAIPLMPAAPPTAGSPVWPPPLGNALRAERTADWVHWRFWGRPDRPYRCWAPRSGAGFGAYIMQPWHGVSVAYVLEACGADPDQRVGFIRALVHQARREGAAAAVAVESAPDDLAAYRQAGFWAVPGPLAPKRFWLAFKGRPGRPERPPLPRTISDWALHLSDWDGV